MLVILSYVGGYMNIREYIKEEGRWEGHLAGKLEGEQKGRQEKERQVIANMFRKNMDIPLISEVTGLSEAELKKLQKKHALK